MAVYNNTERLMKSMTLEQKVAQLMIVPYANMTKEQAIEWAKKGVGSFLHVWGDEANELKKVAVENAARIPLIFGIDAIHGHCLNKSSTVFPTQLSMACSFDDELIEKMASATAKEVSADGLHWTFSPVLCLGRDTRWGRVAETFGEDKYLAGELGAAMIRGYQGSDLSDDGSILACAKHFIGYGEATGARDSYDTSITERKMRAEFLPPFKKAVEADCATIMTAYGSLDSVPCTANKRLLKEILKDELGFNGFVVTDWMNVAHLIKTQRTAETIEEASKIALESGNDMMMYCQSFYDAVIGMVSSGEISEELLDDSVRRILTLKERLGLFEKPFKQADKELIGHKDHIELNKKLADECVVLLKNKDDILPLSNNFKKIAVIGPNSDDIRTHYGDWTYFTHPSANQDQPAIRPYVTFYEGMKKYGEENGVNVGYAKGCEIFNYTDEMAEEAIKLANESDIIFFGCGDKFGLTGEAQDLADTTLTVSQRKLFEELKKTGKPIVLVLISSKPLCITPEVEASCAVITCFNGGMFGGESMAKAIFGVINPEGKLPISFPHHVGQQPTYYNTLPGWHMSRYMDMPKAPLFVFGEGLSYTKFEYSNIQFDKDTFTLTVTLKNAGNREGCETTQVYFRDVISSVMTPVKQLVAYKKTKLQPGEEAALTFKLKEEDFALVTPDNKYVTEKGEFEIMVGSSSKDEDLIKISFRL